VLAKISYEYATRLPRPDELFGNGVLVDSYASLKPEQSHNLNGGPRPELASSSEFSGQAEPTTSNSGDSFDSKWKHADRRPGVTNRWLLGSGG